jgi:transcriptional regulator with XRE-family HTH domain
METRERDGSHWPAYIFWCDGNIFLDGSGWANPGSNQNFSEVHSAMDEIAMAGDPTRFHTDGGMLVRKDLAAATKRANGNGHRNGSALMASKYPHPRETSGQGGGTQENAGLAGDGAAAQTAKSEVSAESAEALIVHKRIGGRIKSLRQRKHMGLVELGRYTGLSASFLSQLETGRVVPTLRNLSRIAMVFSKDLSYFFELERPELFRILRASERQRQPQTGTDKPNYFFESLGHVPTEQTIAPYIAEFLPSNERQSPGAHQHAGAEFLYILSGRLRLTHEGRTETLERGDAVYFDSSARHSYERVGDEACGALILTMAEPVSNSHAIARAGASVQNGSGNGNGGNGAGGQQR